MKAIFKFVLIFLIFVFVLSILLFFFGWIYVKNFYPSYNYDVYSDKIYDKIDIKFDNYANPYIYATNDEDVAYSIGFLHARERLFQMDLTVRTGLGLLSEVMGDSTVAIDIFFRTLGIKNVAQKSYNLLPNQYQKILVAYTKGINDYIENNGKVLPIEFNVLSYKPLKWKPYYPLVVSKLVAWEMNLSWWSDLTLTKMYQKFGNKANLFILDENYNIPNVKLDTTIAKQKITTSLIEIDKNVRKLLAFDAIHIGSNNWVIAGSNSATGKAILCNDPHLVLRNPNFFYFVSINSPTWNTKGFTIPGIPAVIVGSNKRIAWGITNLMLDDCDFYLENVDFNKKTYIVDGKERALQYSIDTIRLLKKEYLFTKYYTHRGPILNNIDKYNYLFTQQKSKDIPNLSIRWTGLIPSTEFKTLIDINKASNFREFSKSFEGFVSPGQNYVYADVVGNIGYVMAGKIPIRSTNSTTIAYDGSLSSNDWKGFVPFDQMPVIFNPTSGFIATANNKVVKSFNYHITNFWEPESRIQRIEQLLYSKTKHSIEDCKNYQNDIVSPYAIEMKKYIVDAFNGFKIKDKNLVLSLELLKVWDGRINKYLQAPLIFNLFLKKFIENTFKDDLGSELYNEYIFLANMPLRVILKACRDGNNPLFDDIKTNNVVEDRDAIIRKSMSQTIDELTLTLGNDIALWQWGKVHKISPKHLFEKKSKVFTYVINTPEIPVNGDGTTIFNTEYLFTEDFNAKISPSFRMIYDFSKDHMFISVPGGQSGHLLNNHNLDQLNGFIDGEYLEVSKLNKNYGAITIFKK